jgi:hypothetical protein
MQARGHVARHPVDADLGRQPDQRRRQCRVFIDVNLLAVDQPAFQLLGEHGGGGKAADKLLSTFAAHVTAALVYQNRAGDVPVASGDQGAAVDVRQQGAAITHAAAAARLSHNFLLTIVELVGDYFHAISCCFQQNPITN